MKEFWRKIKKLWMGLSLVIAWVMTRVILSVMFYLVLTPLAFLLKLSGRDLLNVRRGRVQETFWKDHPPAEHESYENQF